MTLRTSHRDFPPETSFDQRRRLTAAYGEWAERLVAGGWTPDFLTFMFDPIPGSQAAILRAMDREVERVYATFVTHVVRRPLAPANRGRLPVWLCSPDFPVFKHVRQRLADVVINDGAHMHAIALTPPGSRLDEELIDHFERRRPVYVRPEHPLRCIDVEPITHDLGYVVGYGRKAVTRGRAAEDTMLVLPRTVRELTR